MTLTEFLLARIAEDKATASACLTDPVCTWPQEDWAEIGAPSLWHVQNWDPYRVLAECAAKRRIVELHGHQTEQMKYGPIEACTTCGDVDDAPHEWPCDTILQLAAVYADHDDYNPDWA